MKAIIYQVTAITSAFAAVPTWTPTYDMAQSTTIMPCNFSGHYDFEAYPDLGKFGLVDYDWSNAKMEWAQGAPMENQASLIEAARRSRAQNPLAKTFVYRNIVKALPWFEEVRELLEDPAYWGWFLWKKETLRTTNDATGMLYHDFEQTPGHAESSNNNIPDGYCKNNTDLPWDGRYCDCGVGVECGEYLFDHRNESLRAWLTATYMAGERFGLGNENVDGYFLDDEWSATGGPSEENSSCIEDMGLLEDDVADIAAAWEGNMEACQEAIVANGGFNWQLFNVVSTPDTTDTETCSAFLRKACAEESSFQTEAIQWTVSLQKNPIPVEWNLLNWDVDLTMFLLARGDYAWLGYGWLGCGCGWEDDGTLDCAGFPRPEGMDVEYGEPDGLCEEVVEGVFVREWSGATVTMDCGSNKASIVMK